ncbi:hypothetical protein MKX01_019904 [Papaver californicum]|nr:hypothetical protein MKX01_019904 [Papaver californicum]
MNWAVDVTVLNTELQKAQWSKACIYKLPAVMTTSVGTSQHIDNVKKSAAYLPHTVSFGPYHHGKSDHLKKMDPHKHRVLGHFLRRYNVTLQILIDSLVTNSCRWQHVDRVEALPVLQRLMDSYESLDDKWLHDRESFLKLMIFDGCFMLEILQWLLVSDDDKAGISKSAPAASGFIGSVDECYYADNDPIFSRHGKLYFLSYIRRDMLMLENQLPMLLLKTLLGAVLPATAKEEIEEHLYTIILNFCKGNLSHNTRKMGPCLHVLDLYRKSLLTINLHENHPVDAPSAIKNINFGDDSKAKGPMLCTTSGGEDIVRSAMNLHESGIKFKQSTETCNLTDIWFKGHTLRLPVVVIDDTTESALLNLMAFERFHVGAGNEITSYVCFMDNIIDSSDDVKILRSSGVLQNAIGSDKAVAKLFNELTKDVTPDPESWLEIVVQKQLDEYCRNKWHEWRANLIHTYFKNPWTLLSLLAAVLLLALTISQTFYSIYGYYKPSGN